MAAEQPQDKYVVRLPDGMRDRLKAAAEANRRSMNAEIVDRLEESFHLPLVVAQLNREIAVAEEERQDAIEEAAKAWKEKDAEVARAGLLTQRRIPDGLFRRIRSVAAKHDRSVQEEVIQALEAAFPPPSGPGLETVAKFLAKLEVSPGGDAALKQQIAELRKIIENPADYDIQDVGDGVLVSPLGKP